MGGKLHEEETEVITKPDSGTENTGTRLRGRLLSAGHLKCYTLCFSVCSLLGLRHDVFWRQVGLPN